ncbi:ADP-ribose pyrophosphatase [Deinococcus sp.]|uniref:ADP-ribose pyrophosphatase n=1 Tax=Deinococcus sp. TaxID=47478 RepID=UPI0025BE329C|nr:ADP-ribose pyrophosphatase [Deinococcus sp.]
MPSPPTNPQTAVYIGRFEPLHEAHLHTMLSALERHARLTVLPGSANLARSMKNPWTAPERARMIRAALHGEGVDLRRVRLRPLPDEFDMTLWQSQVRERVGTPNAVLVGYGKDASSSYLHWFPEWQVEPGPVTPGLSATDLRAAYFEERLLEQLPAAVRGFLENFRQTRTFRRLQAEHFAVLARRQALKQQASPPVLQEVRFLHVSGGQVWLNRRRDPVGKGLWELPGHLLAAGDLQDVAAARASGRIFDHPSRSLVWPTAAQVVQEPGGGTPIPLQLALGRPHGFFEDHHVILRRMLFL